MNHPEVDRRERKEHRLAAWVVGLLLSFCGLLLPSACTAPAPKSPCLETCSGCCTDDDVCVATISDLQCGAQGTRCQSCTAKGEKCDAVMQQCVNSAGDGGTCGPNCPGCCFNGICLPFSGQTRSSCGLSGEACRTCPAGESCEQGQCALRTPSVTGAPCASDLECQPLGTGAVCRKLTATAKYLYPMGFCTKPCMGSSMCAHDAVCALAQPHETEPLCMPECANPGTWSTCREGYFCAGLQVGTTGACWLVEPYLPDAGPPFERVGEPCTTNAMCGADAGAICLPETLRDGGATGYPGGYCTGDCSLDSRVCSGDGGAVCVDVGGGEAFCARTCSEPFAGQSDCRPDYVCYGTELLLPDGGTRPSTNGICQPSCDHMGALFACADGAYCDGGYCVQ